MVFFEGWGLIKSAKNVKMCKMKACATTFTFL